MLEMRGSSGMISVLSRLSWRPMGAKRSRRKEGADASCGSDICDEGSVIAKPCLMNKGEFLGKIGEYGVNGEAKEVGTEGVTLLDPLL